MTEQPNAYTLYAAFAATNGDRHMPDAGRTDAATVASEALESTDATVRGVYTVSGHRPTPTCCCGSSGRPPTGSRMH